MGVNLADKYFIQAFDNYGFNMDEAIEALNYALSHDSEHSGAHFLLGRMNMEYLQNFELSEYHFQMALVNGPSPRVYVYYSLLLIKLKEYKKARKIIDHAKTIKGANEAALYHREALLLERTGNLQEAKELYGTAFDLAFEDDERVYLKAEVERIKNRLDKKEKPEEVPKKKKKKKKSSKKKK